ncbi:hypothetical protein AB0T83_17820 [Fluviibacterium sp. DFM31]|uniref:Plasmid pRiA4b Orf3-like domain-containing protein n=1 Tax=Meridianimarinicoccus marinus TaxID=3231483 RepID=A0ABV3LAN6_9RHOB
MPGPTPSSNASSGLRKNGPRGVANPRLRSKRRQRPRPTPDGYVPTGRLRINRRILRKAGGKSGLRSGGSWGYEEFLEALADPDHEQHEDMVHWSGGDFDAKDAGADSIIKHFERLAKKWAPRRRKPKATI